MLIVLGIIFIVFALAYGIANRHKIKYMESEKQVCFLYFLLGVFCLCVQ